MALPSGPWAYATPQAAGGTLTDFSYLIDLSRLPQAWWDAVDTSDGTKMRCATDDGTEIAFDVLAFDNVAETGIIRCKATAGTSPDAVRVYPAKTANSAYAASDTYGRYNAYDSHWRVYLPMVADFNDRTSNGIDGTGNGGMTAGGASGLLGSATTFDGSGDYVSFATSITDSVGGARTILIFAKFDTASGRNNLVSTRNDSTTNGGFLLNRNNSNVLNVGHIGASSATVTDDVSLNSTSAFYGLGYTYGSNSGSLYLDGAIANTGTLTDEASGADNGKIGRQVAVATNYFDGDAQHFQSHTIDRSADWIAHEYDQVSDNATFWGTWAWSEVTSDCQARYDVADEVTQDGQARYDVREVITSDCQARYDVADASDCHVVLNAIRAASNSPDTSVTLNLPTGAAATGDVYLLFVAASGIPVTPTGWTQIGSRSPPSPGFGQLYIRAYYRTLTGIGDPTDVTVSFGGSEDIELVCWVFKSPHAVPENVSTWGITTTNNSGTLSAISADDTYAGRVLVFFAPYDSDGAPPAITTADTHESIFEKDAAGDGSRRIDAVLVSTSASSGLAALTWEYTDSASMAVTALAVLLPGCDARQAITSDADAEFDVRDAVSQDVSARYDVRDAVSQDVSARYDVRDAVSQDAESRWDTVAGVTSDTQARWATLDGVETDAAAAYAVRVAISRDCSAEFDAAALVTADCSAEWDVAGFVEVTSDAEAEWDTAALVTADCSAEWDTDEILSAPCSARWDTATGVASDTQAEFDVRQAIASDGDAEYDVRTNVLANGVARYQVIAQVVADSLARWVTDARILADCSAEWDTRVAINADGSGRWDTAAEVSQDAAAEWDTATGVASDTQAEFDVRQAIASDGDAEYDVRDAIDADGAARFGVRVAVDALSASAAYDVREALSADTGDDWDTRASITSEDCAAEFDVRDAIASDAEAEWGILLIVTQDAAASFGVRVAIQSDIEAEYAAHVAVNQDAEAAYAVRVALAADCSARWDVALDVDRRDCVERAEFSEPVTQASGTNPAERCESVEPITRTEFAT